MEVASREPKEEPETSQQIRNALSVVQYAKQARRSHLKKPVLQKEVTSLSSEVVAVDLFDHLGRTSLITVDSYLGYIDFQMLTKNISRCHQK